MVKHQGLSKYIPVLIYKRSPETNYFTHRVRLCIWPSLHCKASHSQSEGSIMHVDSNTGLFLVLQAARMLVLSGV